MSEDKTKCIISGPAGIPEEYKRVKDLLTAMNYDVTNIYDLFSHTDAQSLGEEEMRKQRNTAILDCGWLVLLEGWGQSEEAHIDEKFAKEKGVGISYASQLLKDHLPKQ